MTWNGDISAMGKLSANLRRLAEVPSRAAARVSSEIEGLIEEEFETGSDPYGNAWAPLTEYTLAKRTQTTEPPLTDRGIMRSTLDVKPMRGSGVSITIEHPAAPHQTGWSGPHSDGPARPILPSRTFPARWREAIDAAVDSEVQRTMGRR